MKNLFRFMLVAMAAILVSCGDDYDDTALVGRVDDLENRVEEVEKLCREMNTNISALQAIVEALQEHDYITSVTPITEGGETIGYTINFAKGEPITIYHGEDGQDGQDGKDGQDGTNGKDGQDGVSPVLGVKQHTDGLYYWTINGEWVKDAEGNMVKAEGQDGQDGEDGKDGQNGQDGANGTNGQDGKDGVTPQLKVENGVLFVSYDEGTTWEELGSAVNEEMYIFKSVEEFDSYVLFTLYDGTEIMVAKYVALTVTFAEEDMAPMTVNSTRDIHYTVESPVESVEIEVLNSMDLEAEIIADDASMKTGVVRVTTGAELSTVSKVVLLVSDGTKVVMKSLVFEQPGLRVEENTAKTVAQAGGTVALEFFTNVACEVVIPEEAAAWLSLAPQTLAMEKTTIELVVAANTTYETRSATVKVQAQEGELSVEYTISQAGIIKATVAEFLAAAESADVWYELTGVVRNVVNTTYGNFDLVDESGTIYVYGLTATKVASNDKSFSTLDIDEYDTVTLIGTRSSYNGSAQVGGPAYYVSHVKGEEPEIEVPEGATLATIKFEDLNYTNAEKVTDKEITVDEHVSLVFGKGGASTEPAWYDGSNAIRMYQNGATLQISAPGKTIISIELTFTGGMYYVAADSGELSEESAVRTWTGEAESVKFTCTGTDSSHRAYVSAVKVIYKEAEEPVEPTTQVADCYTAGTYTLEAVTVVAKSNDGYGYVFVSDASGVIPVYADNYSELAIGDVVSVSGDSSSNDPFPARFTGWGITVTKVDTATATYPEPTVVTDPATYFAAVTSYEYLSLTGTLAVEEDWWDNSYTLTVGDITFELYPSSDVQSLLDSHNGANVTLLGYPLEDNYGTYYFIPTAIEVAE